MDTIENDDDEFPCIHRLDSNEIIYSQPKLKYKLVGPYVKGDKLGEGSYAKVKECFHSRTLKRCVMKIMQRKAIKKIPNGEQNVKREIRLLRMLQHENIIKLLDVIYNEEKLKIYIITEYCVTGLQEMLDSTTSKKMPSWQAHKYFLQLIEGLIYLHSKGIIHKDIKPGNLLLTTEEVLKIIDFGVAEQLSPLALDDTITTSQGSPYFQPPEVAGCAEKFPGFKVDVWSSGVTVYNLISGLYPYEGENLYILYGRIRENPVVLCDNLDKSFRSLLEGMLEKDPHLRFSIDDVKKHEWYLRPQPSTSEPPLTIESSISKRCLFSVPDCIRAKIYETDFDDQSENFITEHDLNECRSRADNVSLSSTSNTGVTKGTRRRRKTTSCMSIKGITSCSQS